MGDDDVAPFARGLIMTGASSYSNNALHGVQPATLKLGDFQSQMSYFTQQLPRYARNVRMESVERDAVPALAGDSAFVTFSYEFYGIPRRQAFILAQLETDEWLLVNVTGGPEHFDRLCRPLRLALAGITRMDRTVRD